MIEELKTPDIITDPDILETYNEDTLGQKGCFQGVCRPKTAREAAEIVEYCRAKALPITPQGLRSSLTGAAICDRGLALSMEKMNRILDIDTKRGVAIVEPGIVLADFKEAIADAGMFYPPDPTSAAECAIGGTVATNASGSRSLKYGPTANWVLALEIIDGNGELIRAQNIVSEKNATGFSAIHRPASMFVGSEGTLGIITKIELALLPAQPQFFTVMAFFATLKSALDFCIEARSNPQYSPRSIEFLDDACLNIIRSKAEGIALPKEAAVMIYFEQEYEGEKQAERLVESWFKLVEKHSTLSQETQAAISETQKKHLLELRHHIPEKMNEESSKAVKNGGGKISTDWAVPYKRLPELFEYFETIRHRLGDMIVTRFAHLGEGHPHFNFIARTPEEKAIAEEVDEMMAKKAVELGGVVVGEHGVGKAKRAHLRLQYGESALRMMKAIKREFDPAGIMSPGNIFEP